MAWRIGWNGYLQRISRSRNSNAISAGDRPLDSSHAFNRNDHIFHIACRKASYQAVCRNSKFQPFKVSADVRNRRIVSRISDLKGLIRIASAPDGSAQGSAVINKIGTCLMRLSSRAR